MAAMVLAGSALAGPDWVEGTDAGSTLSTAQAVLGVGQLATISGRLGARAGEDLEDMYLIRVTSPGTFKFELLNSEFDSSLYIFNVTLGNEAFGLLGNLETLDGVNAVLTSSSTDGTGAQITSPGVYALAITSSGRIPVSANGSIFNFTTLGEISGADGPGGMLPHIGWTGEGSGGSYTMKVSGTTFVDVPAPSAAALLVGGLVTLGRRRRA
jgi:hypothetical protein